MTFELDRYFHYDRFVFCYFEQVDVEDFVGNRVELHFLDYRTVFLAAENQFYLENFGGIDKFAYR